MRVVETSTTLSFPQSDSTPKVFVTYGSTRIPLVPDLADAACGIFDGIGVMLNSKERTLTVKTDGGQNGIDRAIDLVRMPQRDTYELRIGSNASSFFGKLRSYLNGRSARRIPRVYVESLINTLNPAYEPSGQHTY